MEVPKVTVVVPCWNEQESLPELIERMDRLVERTGGGWEVLIVDDGSTDGSARIVELAAAERPWLRMLKHPRNWGLGAALRTGFAKCNSPIVCTIDSDCSYPPERLPEFVARVEAGADLVTASPWHPENDTAEASPLRITLSRAVSLGYRLIAGGRLYTYTCLFRAYSRERLQRVHFASSGFSAVTEILVKGLLAGWRVEEVPMPLEARRHGVSKMSIGKAVMGHLRLMKSTLGWVASHRFSR